jgi:hypothetical protein
MAAEDRPSPGVYFGNAAGTVFASNDNGGTWRVIADGLPGVRSIKIAYVS